LMMAKLKFPMSKCIAEVYDALGSLY